MFVFDDFLKATDSEVIPDSDLQKAGEILSKILEKNPKLQKLVQFKLAPRKILVAEGVGTGWSSVAFTPVEVKELDKAAKFAVTYQPLIDYLEAGGRLVRIEDYWERFDYENQWEHFEEPGRTILKQYTEDIRNHLGDPEYYHYMGGAENLKVRTVDGPFKISDSESGCEILDVLNLEEWF